MKIKSPSIPDSSKIQGGFEKMSIFINALLSICFNSVTPVDSSRWNDFLGRVEALTIGQPLEVFFHSRAPT